jgi:hypothetical protein
MELTAKTYRSEFSHSLGQRLQAANAQGPLFHQQPTFAEAARWAFPFKKTGDFRYEPAPPVRILIAPEN